MADVILKAKGELRDDESREMISMLDTKIATINERTKNHTKKIKEVGKMIKKLDKDLEKFKKLIEKIRIKYGSGSD